MADTTKMDLDRDVQINGVTYAAGTGVEVQKEHVEAVHDIVAANQEHIDFATTHHGAVDSDPQVGPDAKSKTSKSTK